MHEKLHDAKMVQNRLEMHHVPCLKQTFIGYK